MLCPPTNRYEYSKKPRFPRWLTRFYFGIRRNKFVRNQPPLAAAILTENSLARFETKTLTVIEDEGPESGRTKASENGMSIRVATGADRQQFEEIFMDTLNAPNQ